MKFTSCLIAFSVVGAISLTACTNVPAPLAPLPPIVQQLPPDATNGAIYREGYGLALFQDVKARQVGDILTIVLNESTQASSSASTSTSKDDSATLSVPSIFGSPLTLHGQDLLSANASAKRAFDGSGDSAQSNKLTGDLTVTVVERMANGNLVVQGEKELRLNQGNEIVRIQGVIRPADITPDNTVPSSRVADAKFVYTGRGALGDANTQGWLGRFLSSRWMPF